MLSALEKFQATVGTFAVFTSALDISQLNPVLTYLLHGAESFLRS